MTHLHFTNFLKNWLSYSLKRQLPWFDEFFENNLINFNTHFLFSNLHRNLNRKNLKMQCFFISAEIGTFNCNSTNFLENLWNEVVPFVETLDQSTKGFFIFALLTKKHTFGSRKRILQWIVMLHRHIRNIQKKIYQ